MTKVMHVSYGGIGNGGVASVLLSLIKSLRKDIEFGCIVFRHKSAREQEMSQYAKLHRINSYFSKSALGKVWDVLTRPYKMTYGAYSICKKEHYDTIHCHNSLEEVYFLLGAKMAGVKKRIAHSHNAPSPQKRGFLRKLYARLFKYFINQLATDRVGCSTLACKDMFSGYDSVVIGNSINLKKYPWKRNPHEGIRFVHVGRFCYQKNQSFTLKVFKELTKMLDKPKLSLVGFGLDEQNLKAQVKELQLEDFVDFVDGRSANIHEAYADADYMILPSEYEGFGIVLIEAQSTGCYCFASDVVPCDVDAGLIQFLPLSIGPRLWAERIVKHINSAKPVDVEYVQKQLLAYDDAVIAQQYRELYEK